MIDIVKIEEGEDLFIADSAVTRAASVVSTQLGSLEYAQDFGADLKFFLDSQFVFQNESFEAYLVERLAQRQINVSDVIGTKATLYETYALYVGDNERTEGLIR